MNEKFTDNTEMADKLNRVSEQTHVDSHFVNELEQKLKTAYKPKTTWWTPSKSSILPSLGWVVMVIAVAWLLSWTIRNLIPTVQPASDITPTAQVSNNTPAYTITPQASATPVLESGEYHWRSTKLILNQPLPQSPTIANVYLLNLNQPVTVEDILALAQKFGVPGEVQEVQIDSVGNPGYMVTDGTQKLEVQSNNHFVLYTDPTAPALGAISKEQARIVIDSFLKKYGFNFEYRVENAPGPSAQQYTITPLTPDGAEIRSDYLMPISYEFTIDGTGQILAFSGFLLNYEALGTFQLITAGEAFQSVLADIPQFGRMESVRGNGGGGGPGFYKINLSGTPVPFPTQRTSSQGHNEYVVKEGDTLLAIAQAYGITPEKIFEANGLSDGDALMPGMTLTIPGAQQKSEGYAYTVVAGNTCRSIAGTSNISVDDLITNNSLPADCSTLTIDQVLIIPAGRSSSDNPYIGKRFEDQRGIFMVNLYRQPDGSLRKEYAFITAKDDENFNLKLEGAGLQDPEQYNNLPINIWGIITSVDEFGNMTAQVERHAIPFPDLRSQILQGQQKVTQINGQSAVLFTTDDGKTYIQAILNGDPFNDDSLIGHEGDQVLLEGFNIPDEFNNGYPVLRIFGGSIATSNDGQTTEMIVTADQPNIYDEIPGAEGLIPPTVTIEKVELVYYLPNPLYGETSQTPDGRYIQPVWRFYGHYSRGDEFEILIQALKQEFLLPQLVPYTPPG